MAPHWFVGLTRVKYAHIFNIYGSFARYSRAGASYIDPGTGSIVLQTLIAGLVGGLYLIKRFWHSIKDFFQRTFNRSN